MQSKSKRQLLDGRQYDYLFPNAEGENITLKKYAEVTDTLNLIPKVVASTLHQTSQLAPILRGATLDDTCRNIWQFVYQHIAYRKDDEGKEQVRSPARTWRDRKQGVDCDCYSTFISSLLTNLDIKHTLRITKYHMPHFQHIYPIVPLPNGKHIIIDCVVDKYNYEEPYSEKKDTPMDLQYLNGTDETIYNEPSDNMDIQDLMGWQDESDFGDLGRRKKSSDSYQPKGKTKFGKFWRKAVHAVNKANPATVLLRNGVLASMKLNLFKVGQRLKWAYLSDAEAQKRGIDMQKFERLKKVRAKLESIYYGAGGKPENFKKAILKGKGNRGHEVSGLDDADEFTPIEQLLGEFDDEFDGLGEPATGAAVAAASTIIASIAGILKGIGNIFPGGQNGASDFENTEGKEGTTSNVAIDEAKTVAPSLTDDGQPNPASNVVPQNGDNNTAMMKTAGANTEDDNNASGENQEGMWEKNKKWMKPTLIGLGATGLLYMGYKALTSNKASPPSNNSRSPSRANQLSGVRRGKKRPKAKQGRKKKQIEELFLKD